MLMENKYYKYLDIIRIIACIEILFYHLDIIKGGYLAVCTFFVLSGYLGVISAFKKEKFSFKDYYIKRFKRIYLPLLIVTFISISVITVINNYNWINLKPEVTSILLGYNNYWQLNANLDYFVRNVSTPFMHYWYIAILLQFEVVFPLVFIVLKKLGKYISKVLPIIILILLGVFSCVVFTHNMLNNNIMGAYYGTLSRLFALLLGMALGFIHIYYKPLILKSKIIRKVLFYIYLILLIGLCFINTNDPIICTISMFITTVITLRLINYSICTSQDKDKNKALMNISNMTYELYLVQYPIIFIMKDIHMNLLLKVLIIILSTFIISFIINWSLKKPKKNLIKVLFLIIISVVSLFGLYTYVIAKDYTDDINKLKNDLAENRALIEQKQKESLMNQEKEEEEWQEYLNKSEVNEKDIEKMVRNLHIIGIGDSVMELAIKNLYEEFPKGYFDAATNRTEVDAIDIIKGLKAKGIDSDVYVLNIGTNGLCNVKCKERVLNAIGEDKYIFWLNATAPDYEEFNTYLEQLAKKHNNVFIIDWRSYGLAHQEYLIYDKVHPNVTGCGIYAKKIYEGVYNKYLELYKEIREKKIKEHEEYEKNKIIFIGNDLLRGIYDALDESYQNKKILVDDYNFNSIKNTISNTPSNNIVLVFDSDFVLTNDQYKELVKTNKDKKITYITTHKTNNNSIIYFDSTDKTELDGIHLSNEGNKALMNIIKERIK